MVPQPSFADCIAWGADINARSFSDQSTRTDGFGEGLLSITEWLIIVALDGRSG